MDLDFYEDNIEVISESTTDSDLVSTIIFESEILKIKINYKYIIFFF